MLINGGARRDTVHSGASGSTRFKGVVGKRRRLLGCVALVVAIGSLTTSIGSYMVSRRAIRSGIVQNQLPLTGDSVYSEVQRDLLRPIYVSEQMAHDTFLLDWYLTGERDAQPIIRYLTEIKNRFHATTSFFVSERTRNYYHPDGIIQQVKESSPGDEWYFRVRTMKTPYEINVDTDAANHDNPTVFVNFRLVDDKNHYLGVTGVGLTLQSIDHVVADYEARFNRRVYFVDHSGTTTLRSNSLAGDNRSLNNRPGVSTIATRILAGSSKPVQLSYRLNGSTIHVNSRYIPELKWFLVVEQNEDGAVQPLFSVLLWNLLLGALITGLVLAALLVTLSRYQRRLEFEATTDSLTKCSNRRNGECLLLDSISTADRTNASLCALLIDIDLFKLINDHHGHLVGDDVIAEVAHQIRTAVRNNDDVIRWGGEEFLVLLPNCDLSNATRIASSILSMVATQHLRSDTALPNVTVSIGVTSFAQFETRQAFLNRVDNALYQAKTAGRNQVRLSTDIGERAFHDTLAVVN